ILPGGMAMGPDTELLPLRGKVQGRPGFRLCWSRLTKSQAEEVIDWLEANGHPEYELDYEENQGYCVRTQPATGAERRAAVRVSVSPQDVAVWLTARDGNRIAATVRDISCDGLGVVVSRPHQPGELVSVDLHHRTHQFAKTFVLTTTRSTRQADGSYLLGGA